MREKKPIFTKGGVSTHLSLHGDEGSFQQDTNDSSTYLGCSEIASVTCFSVEEETSSQWLSFRITCPSPAPAPGGGRRTVRTLQLGGDQNE